MLAIGNVIDTQADYPDTVVASALWHFEPTLDAAIKAVKAGSFKAEDYGAYSFMKAGGCSLSPLGTFEGKVPADVVAKVKPRRKRRSRAAPSPSTIDDDEPKSTLMADARRIAEPAGRSSSGSTASPSASARSSPMMRSASICSAARSSRCWARTAPARPR